MKVSNKISVQKIVEQCQLHGISDIVISPGSRNAPFTLSFTNNPFFTCYSIVDERSAAHFALGIAQQKKSPVAIVCTSGTATLNYAPAIAEAHMQGIPLLVITADRQSNGLEIGDGQVINQIEIYRNFCDRNYNLIEDEKDEDNTNLWEIEKAYTGINLSQSPTHINVQLSEPLYNTIEKEKSDNPFKFLAGKYVSRTGTKVRKSELLEKWKMHKNKLILVSENQFKNIGWLELIIKKDKNVVVLSETTSNLSHNSVNACIDRTIELIDKEHPEGFIPDLIVTIGHSMISKKIKQLFRTHSPKEHWNFSEVRHENLFELANFQSFEYLDELSEIAEFVATEGNSEFKTNWENMRKKAEKSHEEFLAKTTFSDLKAFEFLTKNLPSCNLQMGNSSVVRYLQLFNQRDDIQYNGNRGVSGIEGCTSTALGAHQVTKNSILISGDVSFFYDSNAFWNNYVSNNFKVIVINNGEGNIFKILPQPKKDELSLPFFTTPHKTSIKKFCDLYNLKHYSAKSLMELKSNFDEFITNTIQAAVLEIDTSEAENDVILTDYFNYLKNNN